MRSTFRRTITSLVLVIAMVVGMTASFRKTAKADNKYSITFVGCGGVMNEPGYWWHGKERYTVTPYTEPFPLPEYHFEKTGYKQIGWTTNPSNTKVVEYKAGDKITRKRDTTIYAVYEPKSYTITCQSARYIRGETGVVARFSASYDSYILSNSKLPKPAKGYYRWWYDVSTGKQIASNTPVKGTTTIYYVDKPNKAVATFVVNGSSKVVQVETGKSLSYFMRPPFKNECDFIGWSESSDGSTGLYLPDHKLIVEGSSKTYYPIYVSKTNLTKTVTYIMDKNDLDSLSSYMTNVLNSYSKPTSNPSSLPNVISVGGTFLSSALSAAKFSYASGLVSAIGLGFSLNLHTTSDGSVKIDTELMSSQLDSINKARKKLGSEKTCKVSVTKRYNWDGGVFWSLNSISY